MPEIAKIKEFEKKYPDEWMLVEVLEKDNKTNPTKGKLVAHSKAKDEVYDIMKKVKGHTAIFFTGEIPKKGYAFAF